MLTALRQRVWLFRHAAIVTVSVVAACDAVPDPAQPAVGVALDSVFGTTVVALEESARDSIAEPGIFQERAEGGFLMSDGQLPRVRSYDAQGRLEAAFGRFGAGPFEFQSIDGLAETASGRVVVVDGRQARLTWLTEDLRPDTTKRLPGVPSRVKSLDGDLLLEMRLASESGGDDPRSRFYRRPLMLHRLAEDELTWSSFMWPFLPAERPYWNSIARLSFDLAGDSIYMAFSLRYPVAILNTAGDSIGEIGVPPAAFEPVPVFESGAFSPAGFATQVSDLLGGRTTISHLAVVGSRLVVVHGSFGYPKSGGPFGAYHSSLDVYDRHTGHKLYEDVPLPENSRVLGGGRYLYLLQDTRFPPWRIAKLSFLEANPDSR